VRVCVPQFPHVAVADPAHGQTPAWQVTPETHALLQAPQLPLSVWRLTQAPPQGVKPVAQVMPQVVPSHVAEPFVGTGHAVQEDPHVRTAVLSAQAFPQACEPLGHAAPQVPLLQLAVPPPVGAGQAWPQAPQLAGSVCSFTQPAVHCVSPEGHCVPHFVPSQVAVPPAGAEQALHELVPQLLIDVLLTQLVPQRWVPLGQAQVPA
jgi:hypothetical protein